MNIYNNFKCIQTMSDVYILVNHSRRDTIVFNEIHLLAPNTSTVYFVFIFSYLVYLNVSFISYQQCLSYFFFFTVVFKYISLISHCYITSFFNYNTFVWLLYTFFSCSLWYYVLILFGVGKSMLNSTQNMIIIIIS